MACLLKKQKGFPMKTPILVTCATVLLLGGCAAPPAKPVAARTKTSGLEPRPRQVQAMAATASEISTNASKAAKDAQVKTAPANVPDPVITPDENRLWQAAADGDLQTVKACVARGANVNIRCGGGFAPLAVASQKGYLEIVKFLVEHGAEIDKCDNARHKTALLHAAFKGHADIVKYLVDKGAALNVQGINGWTPLHDAAWVGQVEIVKYLVDHKANLGILNNLGESPLATCERALRTQDPVRRGNSKATRQDYQAIIDYLKSH